MTTALKNLRLAALTVFTGAVMAAATSVAAHTNPVDEISNPKKLDYQDVEARRPDFAEPFLRDGVIDQPQRLQQLRNGASVDQAVALLGQPLKKGAGKGGSEWDYNLKFKMPDSENYMVCQYKLVVDEAKKQIEDAVWRRKQCMDIVNGTVIK